MTKCDGSKEFRHTKGDGSWWENDAAGIPLTRVCQRCRKAKLARYNPAIFKAGSQYAMTGEEADIGVVYGEDY